MSGKIRRGGILCRNGLALHGLVVLVYGGPLA